MSESSNNGGMGFGGALFLVFLVLKLTGYIAWSWWWVTAPLWGGVLFAIAVFLLVYVCVYIGERRKHARRRTAAQGDPTTEKAK